MVNYIENGNLPIEEYTAKIVNDIKRETRNIEPLAEQEENSITVFYELFMYKNHHKIPSLTEIYIKQKRFKDKEKIKLLYAIRDSVVGLFKIIKCDHASGYVTYQDVFTKKRYKIIDI